MKAIINLTILIIKCCVERGTLLMVGQNKEILSLTLMNESKKQRILMKNILDTISPAKVKQNVIIEQFAGN